MQAEDRFAGMRVRCRKCAQAVQVPAGEVLDEVPYVDEPPAEDPYVDDPYVDESAPIAGRPRRKKAKRARSRAEPAANSGTLRSWGLTLSLLGIGSFILPHLGIQFKLVNLFGPAQSIVAGLLAVAGAVLLFGSLMHNPLAGIAAAGSVLFLLLVVFAANLLWDPNAPPGPPRGGGGNVAGPGPMHQSPMGAPQQQPTGAPPALPSGPRPAAAGRPTELLGGQGGSPFHQIAPQDGLLLGVHYRLSEWGGQQVVSSLRCVFDGDTGPENGEQTVSAPAGYAVGGLIVDADKYVNAVQLVFLRVKADGTLDAADTHTSEVIGTPTGRPTRTLAGDGARIVGLHGRKGLIVDSVGLVLAGAERE